MMKSDSLDHPPFEDIAEQLSGPLERYLQRMVGDPVTAEDLLQETLVRVARALPRFEGRSSAKTWAFSIATRVVADHFRRPEARTRIVDLEEVHDLATDDVDIDTQIVVDEMNSCVREVIDSLPDQYRAALVLHDLEGLTAAEVAKACECSVATAKIRIHRARVRLGKALEKECSFYRDDEDVFRCDRKVPEKAPTRDKEGRGG